MVNPLGAELGRGPTPDACRRVRTWILQTGHGLTRLFHTPSSKTFGTQSSRSADTEHTERRSVDPNQREPIPPDGSAAETVEHLVYSVASGPALCVLCDHYLGCFGYEISALNRIHAVGVRSTAVEQATERWRELTPTRLGAFALTFSGLRSSRSTSIESSRQRPEAGS